jgi:hypothetical protein
MIMAVEPKRDTIIMNGRISLRVVTTAYMRLHEEKSSKYQNVAD